MPIGFGGVSGSSKASNVKYNIVKSDGTVLAECKSKEEAEEKKVSISQAINEDVLIKELKLL